ncbi:unnamed protein product [Caenorhabditis auriculariae]|uniref:Uncharacterized protein n=1 Tax=Caenorhabditis auriculariae TaxID=2777116 RepID=A0A8S1HE76_9PELO|nr:unnamed protein product [Caenorhabditis auriculariae]
MTFRFGGKVAIITGSTSGIGRATAVLMAKEGAKVVVTGRSEEGAKETKKQCTEAGASALDILVILGDIGDEKFQKQLVDQTIEKFGKLNILVNNAGALHVDPSGAQGYDMANEILDKSMNDNFRSVFTLTKIAIPHLAAVKGDIVNVSTFLSLGPAGIKSMPYYAISKAALDHLSRSMAHEYISKGVRVNSVNPGLVGTSFFARLGFGEERVRKMEDYMVKHPEWIPLGRVASSEDVAKTICFLADRNSSECIIGQNIVIDSGSRLALGIDVSDFKDHL